MSGAKREAAMAPGVNHFAAHWAVIVAARHWAKCRKAVMAPRGITRKNVTKLEAAERALAVAVAQS